MSLYKSLIAFSMVCLVASCKKDGQIQIENNFPATPITVANASLYRAQPTIIVSKAAGGNISITLQAPGGRVIKEITKVSTWTTYAGLQAAAAGITTCSTPFLYNTAPIAGNNTNQITFTTSLTEYLAKNNNTGCSASAPAIINPPTSNAELGRQFYFLLTMENGEQVIPEFVRVFVVD